MNTFAEYASTPCVSICKIKKGYCTGCKRTAREIAKWKTLYESERLGIMSALHLREVEGYVSD